MPAAEACSSVFVAVRGGSKLLYEPEQVSELFDLFGVLSGSCASPQESIALIERKAGQL
ncbi:hypothetical protein [Streptomyces brasiliensis]|uniref:Uncharacterized protein n=1 Tax=Streptomyces brasiliensis TaxID=1954 RepID=A0A917KXZ4_9ACTN|nr:hypothetical protein [Streptomyces brasiliensis]GGJ32132.1 hypothetical protein GCM10010121_049130 [Streptomyces brasiliensis]